ncbi:LysR family transcriptional regulator [Sphingomonas sp. VDB2]|uniref:LysR family transcriptional regulator n=1 Tax=Sphingomonas sp. VDB2 TaxID=3228751 RepID=UPI003A81193B
MELRQLRYFVTLADTRNFHRAADKLNISQPPLTVAIRKLEEELGTTLFDRGSRGVTLTAAGRAALDIARLTLAQADRFREVVREGAMGERGQLRVGFVGSATFELLPHIIPEYRRLYPLVELVLEEAASTDIARRLSAGELDVGLVRLPLMEIAQVDAQSVDQDEMHAALPQSHMLANTGSVALSRLADEPFILQSRISVLHSITIKACHEAGFVPRVAQEAAQLSAVLALVRSGLGVALVPSRAASAVPKDVRLVRLARCVPIETGVALPRNRASPLAHNFAAIAADSYRISK